MKFHFLLLAFLMMAVSACTALAQEESGAIEVRVRLLTPLSTKINKKNDRVTAQVLEPDVLRGDIVVGKVTAVKNSGKLKGKSILNFTFHTLHDSGQAVPVATQIRSITNSQGMSGVDEEGRLVRRTNNLKKVVAVSVIGAIVGGALAGGRGAVIGAGAGALVSLAVVKLAVRGPSITFAPGSEFTLVLKRRHR
jgi:hypothetical protein